MFERKLETESLLTSRAFCNEKMREHVNSHTCYMHYYYTYKLNVSYFSFPKGFSYSVAPCITSTYCHLKTSFFQKNRHSFGDLSNSEFSTIFCFSFFFSFLLLLRFAISHKK